MGGTEAALLVFVSPLLHVLLMKELSKLTVAATSPTSLAAVNTRVRLIHEGGDLVFVTCPFFGSGQVVLRYRVTQLAVARYERLATVPASWGPIMETIQVFRNTKKYGFWDGQAATNLQNMDTRPRETAPVLKLGFLVPGAEYEAQLFMFTESWSSTVPLVDSAAYLRSLLIKRKRQRRRGLGR
ncbi:MAG: hypothetical protein RIC55_14135 [Pirellulaceae bacterium]